MIEFLLQYSEWGLFILRLVVAVIFLYHGVPKLISARTIGQAFGMASVGVWLLGLVEVLAAGLLATGLWVQYGALIVTVIMVGAIFFKAIRWGIGFSSRETTGWEFDLILLAAAILILTAGPGSIGL